MAVGVQDETDAAVEAAMFAEVFREVLLLVSFARDSERRRHHVVATRMAFGAAGTILAGLDAVRASAARGEPRVCTLAEFVRVLSRATREHEQAQQEQAGDGVESRLANSIGPDASLLECIALEFVARATEAAGIDANEAARCQNVADALRRLATRHEAWFRDAEHPAESREAAITELGIAALLAGIHEPRRTQVKLAFLHEIESGHRDQGTPIPEWIGHMRIAVGLPADGSE
jgi:hypothetical protein